MIRGPGFGGRRLVMLALVVFGLMVVACSPSAAVSSSPSSPPSAPASVAPSPTPTTAPTPSPTPAASASAAAADPAIGLKIAPPYTLQPLDPLLEEQLRQQYASSAGAFASLIGVGGRTIIANGAPVAFAFVIGLPAGSMTDAIYQSMVTGMGSSTGAALTTKTIAGTEVSTGSVATGSIGVYRDGDRMVMAITPQASDLDAVAEALITAN